MNFLLSLTRWALTRRRRIKGSNQMEFPEILSRSGGRTLHRCRSVLSDLPAQSRWAIIPRSFCPAAASGDDMGKYVAENIVKNLIRADIAVKSMRRLQSLALPSRRTARIPEIQGYRYCKKSCVSTASSRCWWIRPQTAQRRNVSME